MKKKEKTKHQPVTNKAEVDTTIQSTLIDTLKGIDNQLEEYFDKSKGIKKKEDDHT